MIKFVMSVAVGIAVAVAWMAIWATVLHTFGIPALVRTAEQRASRTQRILRMGKWRYVLVLGVLGNGVAFGLGIAAASVTTREFADWTRVAVIFAAVSLLGGCFQGFRTWNEMYRGEVPFPRHYPPLK